ncbi:MAG: cytochrome c peroxidase [Dokdonella sp.]
MKFSRQAAPRRAARVVVAGWLACAASIALAGISDLPTPASLGREIFFDTSLSASGRMACSTCHDPAFAHAPANALSVQLGGENLDVPGFRAVPSLRYVNFSLPFFFQADGTPTGGLTRDGSAATLVDQARTPLLAAHEMANVDVATVVDKLGLSEYAEDFRVLFGSDIFSKPDTAFLAALYSLSAYELSASEFHPFSSKYDLFLRGQIMLSEQELRGYVLFNRPDKGNCADCHPSTRQSDGTPPVFTDYTYDNLGVPRNPEIPANADLTYFDMGLCGPYRADLAAQNQFCGQFKVPTLRNVVTRQAIFHNGYFHTLRKAIQFYVQRDTNADKWYPLDADGVPQKFDDIPFPLDRNVNTAEAPYNRQPGDAPALSDTEIDDVIAFLGTLEDGYDPVTDTADPARDMPPPPAD